MYVAFAVECSHVLLCDGDTQSLLAPTVLGVDYVGQHLAIFRFGPAGLFILACRQA